MSNNWRTKWSYRRTIFKRGDNILSLIAIREELKQLKVKRQYRFWLKPVQTVVDDVSRICPERSQSSKQEHYN